MKEERWGKAFWHDSGGFSGGDGAHKRPPVLFPLQGAYFYDEIWMLVQKKSLYGQCRMSVKSV
ncbi:hypothetical protein [Angelakisella massiliensis]|uniref:hypothetical protein n=1 Tax=Angelakisella massiliensis TaxID=1871018 RepID=UPI0023A82AA0|nr:hypothetical protein [Angelakisella massiliensis]